MLRSFLACWVFFVTTHALAESHLTIVPFDSFNIKSDTMLCYADFIFKVPECYEFKNLIRMDWGKKNSENVMEQAQVYIAGVFAHDCDCRDEHTVFKTYVHGDRSPLPWVWEITNFQP